MYTVRLLVAASRQLSRLDKPVAQRIVERIRWLAASFDSIQPEPLTGDLVGFYKLRSGDYRVVYEVLRAERSLVIHKIDHRSRVYRKK